MNKNAMEFFLPDLKATHLWGQQLAQQLPPGTIILLQGDLGAGKTSLVQGLGRGLGITGEIVSPTFTIVNEYREGKIPLYHLDLYRLSGLEVEYLYPEQYWQGEDFPLGITAVEWPERLTQPPSQYLQIQLCHHREGRSVTLTTQDLAMDLKELLPLGKAL